MAYKAAILPEQDGGTGSSNTATSGKILIGNGTDFVASTPTYPLTAGTTGNIMTSDGTNWTSASLSTDGIVSGPASATDNALVRFDGTTGKIIQNGVITEDDTGNLLQVAAVSGSNLYHQISNTSNTASAFAFHQAVVAGSTAADPFYSMGITAGQFWSAGLDNSDSDAYVISSNNFLGTNNIMRVATTGEINFPLQSAFMAYQASTATNVTGDNTLYTLGSTVDLTEVFDQNADFDPTTGTYTAPVTGRYNLSGQAWLAGGTAITTYISDIITSNRTYQQGQALAVAAAVTTFTFPMTVLADMDAADTAVFAIQSADSGGKIDDVTGGANALTFFSGNLMC